MDLAQHIRNKHPKRRRGLMPTAGVRLAAGIRGRYGRRMSRPVQSSLFFFVHRTGPKEMAAPVHMHRHHHLSWHVSHVWQRFYASLRLTVATQSREMKGAKGPEGHIRPLTVLPLTVPQSKTTHAPPEAPGRTSLAFEGEHRVADVVRAAARGTSSVAAPVVTAGTIGGMHRVTTMAVISTSMVMSRRRELGYHGESNAGFLRRGGQRDATGAVSSTLHGGSGAGLIFPHAALSPLSEGMAAGDTGRAETVTLTRGRGKTSPSLLPGNGYGEEVPLAWARREWGEDLKETPAVVSKDRTPQRSNTASPSALPTGAGTMAASAAQGEAARPMVDVKRLADEVWRMLEQRLVTERERRGR